MRKFNKFLAVFAVTATILVFVYLFTQTPGARSPEWEKQLIEQIYGAPLK